MQRQVLGHLKRLSKDLDMQVIMATHSLEIASNVTEEELISLDLSERGESLR
ncbi:MAG: hypothetical protein JXR96_01910 [Deltaproteobacteria bacterium]|nr:hypothetical protein [Deltaproteobacteria bacterium]